MASERELAKRSHAMLRRVMDVEPPLRRAFVHDACADDPELAKRLLELLDAAERTEAFLDVPALAMEADQQSHLPDAVGSYLVVGVLGVGGMATVYEAIQEQPKRRVALKVLHQSMTHTDAYQRFLFETETLAKLHHPGIAQIYEAGAAPLGEAGPAPFFAMELISDATPITACAERHNLTLRGKVTMFADVCDAVHHGHQHGVIHRDIKPGNVLVDGEGRPKVIDFGIARTTEPADSLTAARDVHQLIGTLNYMSPEQCGAGSELDIRTDVYSLGVLLYEMICGRLPHDLSGLPLPAALRVIVHDQPHRPALVQEKLDRDLEAIIMKAIEKEPGRRYDSASALAADLRRWLNHQAIEARPPGVLDQCRLFARRNRALVATGLSILLSLVCVAVLSTMFVVRLSEEVSRRRDAEEQSVRERDLARWQAYTAQIAGALSAMQTGDYYQMRRRLAAVEHEGGGWEWQYLSRLAERSLSSIEAHEVLTTDLVPNRDWTRFLTTAADGSVKLWNAADMKQLAAYRSESGASVFTACFVPGRSAILAGDDDGVVRLLDDTTLELIEEMQIFPAFVRSIGVLPDDRIAITAASGRAMILTLEPRIQTPFAIDQPGGFSGFELSSDGALMATYNGRGSIWLRQSSDFAVLHQLTFPGGVSQVRFSRDGRLLAAVGASTRLIIWNVEDGSVMQDIQVTRGVNTIRSLGFSNDGKFVAAGLIHRGIVICSVRDGSMIAELGGHTDAVSGVQFAPDDSILVSVSWDRTIRTWQAEEFGAEPDGATLRGHRGYVRAIAFSPDGSMAASASVDGSLLLWDPDLAQPIARLSHGGNALHAVEFSSDGKLLAAACLDGTVIVWDSATAERVATLEGNRLSLSSLAFDASGERIVAGANDGLVYVWNVQTSELIHTLTGHTARSNSVDFSPDGSRIASGSRDRTVRLWNAHTGAELYTLTGYDLDVFTVLFSPDGTLLYTGSRDQTIRVWDVKLGVLLATLDGHGHFVTSLSLHPDGTRLAASSWFGDVLLFDVETLDLIASFPAHESAIRGVRFSPNGRWLATASYDSTVRLFDSASVKAAEAAKAQAIERFAAATQMVRPLAARAGGDARVLLQLLEEAQIDEQQSPWVRKAVLAAMAPVEETP